MHPTTKQLETHHLHTQPMHTRSTVFFYHGSRHSVSKMDHEKQSLPALLFNFWRTLLQFTDTKLKVTPPFVCLHRHTEKKCILTTNRDASSSCHPLRTRLEKIARMHIIIQPKKTCTHEHWNVTIPYHTGVFGSPGQIRNSPPNRNFEEIRCLLGRLVPSPHS
jgi:hypothetical protein